jgi:hypothetical protein
MLLCQKCIQCTSFAASQPGGCVLTFGSCCCVFHEHCLAPWLRKQPVCPIHMVPWCEARPLVDPLRLPDGVLQGL